MKSHSRRQNDIYRLLSTPCLNRMKTAHTRPHYLCFEKRRLLRSWHRIFMQNNIAHTYEHAERQKTMHKLFTLSLSAIFLSVIIVLVKHFRQQGIFFSAAFKTCIIFLGRCEAYVKIALLAVEFTIMKLSQNLTISAFPWITKKEPYQLYFRVMIRSLCLRGTTCNL